jgi:hypothetical protein
MTWAELVLMYLKWKEEWFRLLMSNYAKVTFLYKQYTILCI